MMKIIGNTLIIGVGLIGGSLAKAMLSRGISQHVVGFSRQIERLRSGLGNGVLTAVTDSLPAAVAKADLIVFATPTLIMESYIPLVAQYRKQGSVVTDVASVKGSVKQALEDYAGDVPPWFVLGHPIAGSEKSGIGAANESLFVDHNVILTPLANTDKQALALVHGLWEQVGACVKHMSVADHDAILGATSHLPHVLAYTYVHALQAAPNAPVDLFDFTAGGFRDFTRIASSDPTMWSEIVLANAEAIRNHLGDFKQALTLFEQALYDQDQQALYDFFLQAKVTRDKSMTPKSQVE